jgi:serine/threonine protein kinase
MSPERLESGEMDAQSDFWALGVILYQMVGGVAPFAAPDTRRLERLIVPGRGRPSNYTSTRMTTRRFWARPSRVLLGEAGLSSP